MPMRLLCMDREEEETYLEQLYEKYEKKLYVIAKQILHHHEDAQDCVHNVIIRIAEHWETYRNKPEDELKLILLAACRNEAKQMYNRRKRDSECLVSLSAIDSEQASPIRAEDTSIDLTRMMVCQENRRLVRQLIEKLDAIHRDVLILRYYENMTVTEIATLFGVAESTVYARLTRAKQKILELGGKALYDTYKFYE